MEEDYYKNYYQKNKIKYKKAISKWKKLNPDKIREQKRRWRAKHHEEINQTIKLWRKISKNNKKSKEDSKKYRKMNTEKIKKQRYAYNHLRNILIGKRGSMCENCGENFFDIHHLKYENEEDAVVLLCRSCHSKTHKGLISPNFLKGGYKK